MLRIAGTSSTIKIRTIRSITLILPVREVLAMKNKIWLLQIPIVVFFALGFFIAESGVQGDLHNKFLREKAFPALRTVNGWFTNLKFFARGPIEPKNKIVIVEIDSDALAQLGR